MENRNEEQNVPNGAPADGAGPLESLKAALAEAEAKAAQNRDAYVRAVAEQDNLRKRAQRDLENAHKFSLDRIVNDLLPVNDSLEMALQSVGEGPEAASQLATGVGMTLRLLSQALER